jgi:hypothetical protein
MSVIYNYRMQQRVDTFANWTVANPILASGEIAVVSDQNKMKVGDGVQSFNALPYITDNINTDDNATFGKFVRIGRANDTSEGGEIRLDYPNNDGTFSNKRWTIDVIGTADAPSLRFYRHDGNSFAGALVMRHDGRIIPQQGISFDNGANTLEHYEEGTFTPTLYGTTTAGSPTYVTQEGSYTRIGNICYVTFRVLWSSLGGATGSMRISGLPFTIVAGHKNRPVATPTYYHSLSLPSGMSLKGYGVNTTNYIRLQLATNITTSGSVTEAHLTEAGELYFNMTYMV